MHMQRALGLLAVLVLATCALSVNVVAPPAVGPTLDALRGLPIHEFFDASNGEILLRDPEAVTRMGLAADFDIRNDQLTPGSREYVAESCDLAREIRERLIDEYIARKLAR